MTFRRSFLPWIMGGLAIGILFLAFFPPIPQSGDTLETYLPIARNLLEGKGFTVDGAHPTASVPPFYPLFLAGAFAVAGSLQVPLVQLLQFAALGFIAAMTAWGAARILRIPRGWARGTGVLVLAWPYFVLYASFLLTEVLYTAILIAAIISFFALVRAPRMRTACVSGFFLGAALLTRPSPILFPFWIVGAALAVKEWRSRAHRAGYALVLIVFLAMQIPWLARNARSVGTPLPITNVGVVVWKGVSIRDWRTFATRSPGEVSGTERERNHEVLARAFSYMRAHPQEVASGMAKKALRFFAPGADGSHAARMRAVPGGALVLTLYRIVFFALLALAALGVVLRRDRIAWLLSASILYFWILHTVLFPYPRYTLPLMPVVFMLAAIGGTALSRRRVAYQNDGFFARKLAVMARAGRMLDIGGGDGPVAKKYPAFFKKTNVAVVDADPATHPDVVADICALPFPDASVDAIVCTSVLQHVPDPVRAMEEVARVLKPGGMLLMSAPFAWPYHGGGAVKDYYRFSEDALRYFLRMFSSVEIARHGGTAITLLNFVPFRFVRVLFWPFARAIDRVLRSRHSTPGYGAFAVK